MYNTVVVVYIKAFGHNSVLDVFTGSDLATNGVVP